MPEFKPITFKTPPSSARASNTSQQQTQWQQELNQLQRKAQELKQKIQTIQQKLPKILSPAYRQNANQQIQGLKRQYQGVVKQVNLLKSRLRSLNLQKLELPLEQAQTALETSEDAPDIQPVLSWLGDLLALYPEQATPLQSTLRSLLVPFETKVKHLENRAAELFRPLQGALKTRIQTEPLPLSSEENKAFMRLEQHFDRLLLHYFVALSRASAHEPEVRSASPASAPEADAGTTGAAEVREALEVRFDMAAGKTRLQNQLGVDVQQRRLSYEAHLAEGFAVIGAIDENLPPQPELENAIDHFLSAISQNNQRHEAYFGLGYLYSLLQVWDQAFFLLDLAWQISSDPEIHALITSLRAAMNQTT